MRIRIFALLIFLCFTVEVRSQVEVVSTGVGSAYVLNVPAVFPLRNGIQVTFKANVVCAAAPTINVSATGPILIKKEGGSTNLAAGDIKAGQVVTLVYDGAFWQMTTVLGNAVPPGSVTGTGTQNYVTKWNNAGGTSIGNSTIFDDGTNVSIGTTTASSLFHVYGGGTPQITIENTGGNFKTGYRIKTGLNEWFIGQEGTATTGFRITDIDVGAPRFQIDQAGNVSIGTTTPSTTFHVAGTNPSSIVNQVAENVSSNIQSGIIMQRSRGTVAAPTAVQSGDNLGGFYVMGHDGAAFGANGPTAGMRVTAAENFTPGTAGSNMVFETTTLGDNTSTERMVINSSGFVGIAVQAPTMKLDVRGVFPRATTAAAENIFQVASNDVATPLALRLGIKTDATSGNRYGFVQVEDGGTTRQLLIQPSGGQVGIGTTTPSYLLDVNGTIRTGMNNTDGALRMYSEQGATDFEVIVRPGAAMTQNTAYTLPENDGNAGDVLSAADGNGLLIWQSVSSLANAWSLGGNSVAAVQNLGTTTAFDLPFITSNVERMRLRTNGYLGIGTTNPSEMLQIEANTSVAVSLNSDPAGTSRYYMGSTAFDFAGAMEYNNSNNSMNFWTNNTPNRLFISGAGNVGVGSSTPSSLFSVGSGATSPFQINASGNIMSINGVVTSFPAAQGAAGTFLQNNGAGILTWATVTGTLSGGTTNQIPKWTSATSLGNSQISDNGTSVTVATNTNIIYSGTATRALGVSGNGSWATFGAGLSVFSTVSNGAANSNLASIGFGDGFSEYTAYIKAVRDAAGAASDYPTALTFFTTADGAFIPGERMRIDNAGNLGIGLTVPAAKLHSSGQIRTGIPSGGLGGAVATLGSILFYNTATTNTAAIQSGSTSSTYTLTLPPAGPAVANSALVGAVGGVLSWAAPGAAGAGLPGGTSGQTLRHDGTNWVANSLLFNNGSNIGLGTVTPAARLHVFSGPTGSGLAAIEGSNSSNGSELQLITLGTGALALNNTGTKGYRLFSYGDAYSTANLQNDLRLAFVNGTGHTPVFNIDLNGNVGIGLSSLGSEPLNSLDVGGGVVIGSTYASTNTAPSSGLLVQGQVGIGETSPVEILELSSTDSDIDAETYSITESSSFHVKRARGTAAVPAIPLSGDYFGGVGFQAWDGSAFQEGARIQGTIDGSPAANDMPGRLEFWTAPDGTASAVERMRISSTGNVGIGTTLPGSSRLNVVIPSTDALNPIGLTVTNNYTGASTKYGIDVNVDGAGSGAKYGISSSVIGLAGDASSIYGYQVAMTPSGTGTSYGLYSSMSAVGTGIRYGFYNNVPSLSTNTSTVYGINSFASKPAGSTGTVFGAYIQAQNDGTGACYGLQVNSVGATATRFGLYVSNETDNYMSGNLGLGTTAPAYQLQLTTNSAAKPTSNAWTIASDGRLKTNVHPYEGGLTELMKIKPVWFTYTGEANMPKETGVGVIAQDLQEVAPYMVKEWTFVPNDPAPSQDSQQSIQRPEGKKYLGVDNGAMTYMLINAVKEQQAQILELKKTLEEQKKLIEKLENK